MAKSRVIRSPRVASPATVAAAEQPQPPTNALPNSFKAFTTLKVPGGWSFIELTLDKDLNVTDLHATPPDVRAIVQERFKITVGKHWLKQEG